MAIVSFWIMYDNIIPLILRDRFEMNDATIGIIMALDNILALFMLPIFGVLSDKTHTRRGRRIPYIVIGTFCAGLFVLFLPFAVTNNRLMMFMVMLGLAVIAMNVLRAPAVALMPDVTPRLLRSRANAVINVMGSLGALYSLIIISRYNASGQSDNYTHLFVAVVSLMIVCVGIMAFTIKENNWNADARLADKSLAKMGITFESTDSMEKLPKDKKMSLWALLMSVSLWYIAYDGVTTVFSRYVANVWGNGSSYEECIMIATIAAIVSYIPNSLIAAKIGRKKTIIIGILCMTAGFIVCGLLGRTSVIAIMAFVIVGFGWAAINVNSYPMVVEIADDGEEGRFTGYYYIFAMAGQVLTAIISGMLIQFVSYRLLFPYAVIFCLLALISMSQVKHGDIVDLR